MGGRASDAFGAGNRCVARLVPTCNDFRPAMCNGPCSPGADLGFDHISPGSLPRKVIEGIRPARPSDVALDQPPAHRRVDVPRLFGTLDGLDNDALRR